MSGFRDEETSVRVGKLLQLQSHSVIEVGMSELNLTPVIAQCGHELLTDFLQVPEPLGTTHKTAITCTGKGQCPKTKEMKD